MSDLGCVVIFVEDFVVVRELGDEAADGPPE